VQGEWLVRALAVERRAEAIKLALLSPSSARGRVGSAVSVRCRRSWRPCCWGVPGSMHAGKSPRRIPQAERCESRPRVLVAKGTPLSVRMRLGQPNAVKRRVNPGLASATWVEASA
jgi:hypothetical protein